MSRDNLLRSLERLAAATVDAEGPGLLSGYHRVVCLDAITAATVAAEAGDYDRCADLLWPLDGPVCAEIRQAALGLAFDEAEEAFDARNEQTPNYQGRSGL